MTELSWAILITQNTECNQKIGTKINLDSQDISTNLIVSGVADEDSGFDNQIVTNGRDFRLPSHQRNQIRRVVVLEPTRGHPL